VGQLLLRGCSSRRCCHAKRPSLTPRACLDWRRSRWLSVRNN
jgi:hypothetical protein